MGGLPIFLRGDALWYASSAIGRGHSQPPSSPLAMLSYIQSWLQQPDGFPPSPSAAMDGCYTRVLTPHGTLILIIWSVGTLQNAHYGIKP